MIHLDEVVDPVLLATMVAEGYIRVRPHPALPLTLHNYSEKAQYESVWNAATLACRGLISHAGTGEVLARPFPKFFTHGQAEVGPLDLSAPVSVTDKADGSLGVLYPAGDGHQIATRGSFASDQALHATALWRERYADYTPPAGLTLLFEIVYPANRIVVDYADLDDLILLGAVATATGLSLPRRPGVAGPPGGVVRLPDAGCGPGRRAPGGPRGAGRAVQRLGAPNQDQI